MSILLKLKLYLMKPKSFYGRRSIPPGEEGLNFIDAKFPNYFNPFWIASDHFTIERNVDDIISSERNVDDIISSAMISVHAENGIVLKNYQSQLELPINTSAILRNRDVIAIGNLKTNHDFFQFFYENTISHQEFPEPLTSNYLIGQTFSKGGQGSVRKIYKYGVFPGGSFSNKIFAMKTICKVRRYDDNSQSYCKMLEHLDQEITNMIKVCYHPNIVRLFESYATPDFNFLVMEFCHQNLLNFILAYPIAPPESDVKFIFYQICNGLKFIHAQRIAHRDIKAENIFMSCAVVSRDQKLWVVKIGDFGFSKNVDDRLSTQLGTDYFIPPELLHRQEEEYDLSADIWCLGCLLFVMLSRKFPFHQNYEEMVGLDLKNQILNAEINWSAKIWKDVRKLYFKCRKGNKKNKPCLLILILGIRHCTVVVEKYDSNSTRLSSCR